RTLHAPEGPRTLGLVRRLDRDRAIFDGISDLVGQAQRQRALRTLDRKRLAFDRGGDARRHGDRLLTNAAHQKTSARTSPPTFCSRASASDRTPLGVETMVMPRPLRTRGSSFEPE